MLPFVASVRHLAAEKHLDLRVLHGDGTNTVAKKGGMVSGLRGTDTRKARKSSRSRTTVEPAEAAYHQALTLADELGMRPLQAHCHHGLGTLYAQIGRRQQARAALTTAIALYCAMDIAFWLPLAEVTLAHIE